MHTTNKDNEVPFVCRVCGWGEFAPSLMQPEFFTCCGCSVLFTSPEAWSAPEILFMKLSENAIEPMKACEGDVAYDLFSAENVTILPGQTVIIKTDIAIELPHSYEAQIRSRSGNAAKKGLMVANGPGTIDTGYRGNIGVILFNNGSGSSKQHMVHKGDAIAQMLISPKVHHSLKEVTQLSKTERGEGGFGHTGN